MSAPLLQVERIDNIAVLTLNRPDAMNALSKALRKELVDTFRALKRDDTVAAAILTGSGRCFSAGVDLEELSAEGIKVLNPTGPDDLIKAIGEFDRPLIGAINGPAITGGYELALACDMLVATPKARFADTHARVGVIPCWGLSQKLSRLIGANRARELSFTGNFLSAEKAEAWGLVNRVVSAEELMPTCLQLARDMASCDAFTLRHYKRLINEGTSMSLDDGLKLEIAMHELAAENATAEKVAARVKAVLERGREQKA